ncbi:hypothetical protein [Nocardia sp. NPDC058497]|uniref:hypothetical protein n=1 Tax=Nocardia sp. NPDC058497 TaxID=3346529 RepID=UPI00364B2A53
MVESSGLRVPPQYGPFLSPQDLLRAVSGSTESDCPLAQWAGKLGSLYRAWLGDPSAATIRHQVAGVVHEIDVWIAAQLPRPRAGTPRGTDSVGGVIARVAEASACAHWALHHMEDAVQRHRAWDHLAEMREGYEDLVVLAMSGLIRLPKSWPGISWLAGATAK